MAPRDPAKRFKHLNLSERAKIIAWSEAGLSSRAIAERIGRDKATVNRIVNKVKLLSKDDIPVRKPGSGRPRLMTDDKLLMLKRQIRKYPAMTAADLKETVLEVLSLSDRTIQHHLQKSLSLPSRPGCSEASPDTKDEKEEAGLLCSLQVLDCS
jgi:transposase